LTDIFLVRCMKCDESLSISGMKDCKMRDRAGSDNGNRSSKKGLGKSVLIARPVKEERHKSNWLSMVILIPLIIALLVFAYGLFYRLAEERVEPEAMDGQADEQPFEIEDPVLNYVKVVEPVPEPIPDVEPVEKAVVVPEKVVQDTFVISKPAVIIDKDEYIEGIEDKLRVMATRLNDVQKKNDLLRKSLVSVEGRNGELLTDREGLRLRVENLEQQLEDATLILEEIANY